MLDEIERDTVAIGFSMAGEPRTGALLRVLAASKPGGAMFERPGGLYVIDDLLPRPNWPDGHAPKVPKLIEALERDQRLKVSKLSWSSGIVVAAPMA